MHNPEVPSGNNDKRQEQLRRTHLWESGEVKASKEAWKHFGEQLENPRLSPKERLELHGMRLTLGLAGIIAKAFLKQTEMKVDRYAAELSETFSQLELDVKLKSEEYFKAIETGGSEKEQAFIALQEAENALSEFVQMKMTYVFNEYSDENLHDHNIRMEDKLEERLNEIDFRR